MDFFSLSAVKKKQLFYWFVFFKSTFWSKYGKQAIAIDIITLLIVSEEKKGYTQLHMILLKKYKQFMFRISTNKTLFEIIFTFYSGFAFFHNCKFCGSFWTKRIVAQKSSGWNCTLPAFLVYFPYVRGGWPMG